MGSSDWRKKEWSRHYRGRILAGLEHCRVCGLVSSDLTFDHIVARSRGGPTTITNITIMCKPHQQQKGANYWAGLKSLWDEEQENGRPPSAGMVLYSRNQERALREKMAAPNVQPTTTPVIEGVWKRHAQLLADHATEINRLKERILQLERRDDKMTVRVQELETKLALKSAAKTDTWGERILEFLGQYPGLKFNSGTIAANLGTEAKFVSDKLKILVGRGKIKGEKMDGLSAMFWIEKKEEQ